MTMNPGVRYEIVNESDCMDPTYPQLYQQVYGNDPERREGRKGPDGELITLDEYQRREKAGEKLIGYEEVYPIDRVEAMYQESKSKVGYIEVRAYVGCELVGVLQGRGCDDPGMEAKLGLEHSGDLVQALGEASGSRHYLAEVFVAKGYQGKGILTKLLNKYYGQVSLGGYDSILTRTIQDRDLPMKKFEKDLFENIGCYPKTDQWNRALFLKKL